MPRIQHHLRNTFLAGIFAALPVAITAVVIWWVNDKTIGITDWLFHRRIPFLGVLIAIAAIYLSGLITKSLLGQFFLRGLDTILSRVPVLSQLYSGWKQIALTPGGTEGIYSKVCLISDESGYLRLMGFTRGVHVDNDPDLFCVYVPGSPNPVNGRLYFVRKAQMQLLSLTTEEAFKLVLSTGNYVPPGVGIATAVRESPVTT